jgi:lysophospholipase L1-like esterase
MRSNTPVFTSYLKLRHTNPDAYHCANTIEQMISLQRKHGIKFYELPQYQRETL